MLSFFKHIYNDIKEKLEKIIINIYLNLYLHNTVIE